MAEQNIPFQNVVNALLGEKQFPGGYLQYFSDIDPHSLDLLMKSWPAVSLERKLSLLEQLEATAEDDTLVCFDDLARALLDDPDTAVRSRAIRLLMECDD